MPRGSRYHVASKVIETILALKRGATTRMLANQFNSTLWVAQQYIDTVSVYLPVIAINEDTRKGPEPFIYKLMEDI